MKGVRLNKQTIDAATYHGKGADYRWDSQLRGFALRVYPSGLKSFVVTYRVRGKQRFYTVGRYGEMTVRQARAEALEVLAAARKGRDPGGNRIASRQAPTMTELAEKYIREHVRIRLKPSNARRNERIWKRHILPRLGQRKVADVDREDIATIHSDLVSTPVMANRVRTILSKAFNLAELWGWRPEGTNPCRRVRPFKEQTRERYLSEQEMGRLGAVLDEAEKSWEVSRHALMAIRLLILTGCRSGEILTLRWEWVDFERRCLRLPDSKTGRKTVKLNSPALEILAGLERVKGNPFVVPGNKPGSHRGQIHALWDQIRVTADLKDVRIHDLRHTYASYAVNAGFSLPMIGKILGHRKTATTERYAHLADDPVVAANEQIGATLESTLAGKPKAEVVLIGERIV